MPLGHLGINVPDLARARRYYDQLMPLLGYERFVANDDEISYRPAAGKRGSYLFIYPATDNGEYSRYRAGLQHLAFMVPTRSAVEAVHAHMARFGGEVVRPPQEFPQYPPPYYATFWLDPFGFMLEAVCHYHQD